MTNKEAALKLFVILSRANRAVTDEVKKDIKNYGLNPTEFAVLELLYHKGDQPIQQIGERILLASGSITYVVDKLEKKEYLMRRPCPNDRRITYAAITETGKEFMDGIFPSHEEKIEEIFSELTLEEKQDVATLLKKLGKSLNQL